MDALVKLPTEGSSPEKVLWDQVYRVARKRGLSVKLSRLAADASVIRANNIAGSRSRPESNSNNASRVTLGCPFVF